MSASRPRALLILLPLVAGALLLALFLPLANAAGQLSGTLQVEEDTSLAVAIHSSPIAVRDGNKIAEGPRLFVVQAVVTNTGTVSATELLITLDYQEDPATGWVLAEGEEPERTPDFLLPGEVYHAYWFASYPATLGQSHQYTVTAAAANAAPVATSTNIWSPLPDETVHTAGFSDTGSNGILSLSADIAVGVAFTMVVDHGLEQNPDGAILSPVGNLIGFDAGLLRLQTVSIRFHNRSTTNPQEVVVADQLYFPQVPRLPDNSLPAAAVATYTFIATQPGSNRLCPYLGLDAAGGGANDKYDRLYCQPSSTAELTGTVGFDFDKQVSAPTIQQGETLTYDLHYTNTGTLPMVHTWIWDETDPQLGQILLTNITPTPTELSSNLVAWYRPWVEPAAGETFTFDYLVDGAGADLPDGTIITNTAFFGINEGSLPDEPATNATVTTTVMAPDLSATKSDGLDTVDVGVPFAYTIIITNDGSVAAVNLSATDLLPAAVELAGSPVPPHDDQTGQLLTWDALPDLPAGETMTITIPVVVAATTPSFTTLTDDFELAYENPAGHHYQPLHATDTTTVLRPAAFVEGIVFDDANGNGLFDASESGIENVELSLPGAYTPTVHTGADGFYQFRVEADGMHTITETDLAGYISTTPNRVTLDLTRGETYTVNFGDILASETGATLYGTVFDDADGDGLWDLDEAGIPNVTVTLDGTIEATTDVYGRYTFGAVAPGLHTVVETDPAGYLSTTPNTVAVPALAGEAYEVNFGDMMASETEATLYGTVFDDADGDGLWDPDEPGIPGVTISLDDDTQTTTTDAYGSYTFGAVAPGLHTVEETDPTGYLSTTPNRVTFTALADATYEVNFGDVLPGGASATIYGTVFADTDGDGIWDLDELGLPNVTITLDGDATTTTDAFGRYTFGSLSDGLHTVVETDPAGYVSTTPNTVVAGLVAGQTVQVNFGDRPAGGPSATIHGTVFDDLDGNGLHDPGEPGIAGATVVLDGVTTRITSANGSYSFGAVPEGLHTVAEIDPAGFVSTTPNRVAVTAVSGQSYQVNFGDILAGGNTATIYGTVFADNNADGTWDVDEPGLPNVTVALDGIEVTTDAFGSYTFGAVAPGIHTVVETDPAGYLSTTANTVAVNALAGTAHEVNFGDVPTNDTFAAIYGAVFDDTNGNGLRDSGELGLPNVTVTLDGTTEATTTDTYGTYTFGAVAPGLHTVAESDDPLGYISTTPNRVTFSAAAGESYEVNFGDRLADETASTLFGTVFADSNGNTLWDPTEAGIPGVTVTLDGTAETTTTDAYGSYTFGAVTLGAHEVVETDLPGYISTTPNEVSVTASAGIAYEVNFGDVMLGTGSCPADGYEPDDTYLTASPLNPGPAVQHDFCGGDPADWHTITVERGYLYTFTTAATGARADTFLALFDQDGTTLLAANDDFAGTADFSSQIVWTAPDSGTYYLRITNRAGLTEWLTDYDIWVEVEEQYRLLLPLITRTSPQTSLRPAQLQTLIRLSPSPSPLFPTGVIDHCYPGDLYEVNDTWELAKPIAPGVAQTHTFDSNPDIFAADKDFVTFEVGPGGSIAASVDSTSPTTLLELYDANGQYLNRSGTDSLVWANAPIGRYYLGVSPATPAYACDGSVSYDLTVDYTPHYRLMLPYVVTE